MTIEEVKEHFGSWYQVIKQVGFSPGTPRLWTKRGFIPEVSQLKIQYYTDSKLKFRKEDLHYDTDGTRA